MGVKFGIAFGAHTTVISRGSSKKESALKDLGAHSYLDSTDSAALTAANNSFDFILSTISAPFNISPYLNLLKTDGKLVMVGAPPEPLSIPAFQLIGSRRVLTASLIGGIKETQDMLDFCGRHNIVCDIELTTPDKIDSAFVRTLNSDVKYRFVIDTSLI